MRTSHLLIGLSAQNNRRVPTFAGAVELWLLDRQGLRNLREVTTTWYQRRIEPLLKLAGREIPVSELTVEHVLHMQVASRTRGNSSQTIKDDYGVIRAFTRWCVRQGYPMDVRLVVMEPPIVEDPNHVEIYTPGDVAKMQAAWAGSLRNTLIIGLLLGTGLRLSELVGLRVTDRQNKQVEIRWVTAKGRKTRWPPLSSRLQRDWVRYVQEERPRLPGRPELLLTSVGEPISGRGVSMAFFRLSLQLGIHAHAHKFRHTFATWYIRKHLEKGEAFDPEQLRMILGHENYSLFPRYVHLARQDMLVKGWDQVAPY